MIVPLDPIALLRGSRDTLSLPLPVGGGRGSVEREGREAGDARMFKVRAPRGRRSIPGRHPAPPPPALRRLRKAVYTLGERLGEKRILLFLYFSSLVTAPPHG